MTAQESGYHNIEECHNYNNFFESEENMDSIWNYVTEIRSGGRMIFKPEAITSETDYDQFISFLDLDSSSTFEFVKEHPNRHQPKHSFLRYQQYLDGIPIEGGGVVISGLYGPGSGPDGPGGPCVDIGMMVPHVANDVNVDINPTLTKFQAFNGYDTLGSSSEDSLTMIEANLVITSNLNKDCNYHLAWKFLYLNEYNSERFAYIDAHNGEILLSGDNYDANMDAPTHHYDKVSISNFKEAGITWLKSPDNRIMVYRYSQELCGYGVGKYLVDSIPKTTSTDEWTTETDTGAFQAFYVAEKVLPYLDQLDIQFDTVHLMVGCNRKGGFNNRRDSDLTNSYTSYGLDNSNKSFATFNIVCHELTHGYLSEFIDSGPTEGGSLHEGIADMFGIYCNYRFTSQLNWEYGFETDENGTYFPRDLENPLEDCFTNVNKYLDEPKHKRGMPLGHLFYLLVEGGADYGAPIFTIEKSLNLILTGLPELNKSDSDYPQLRDATLNQAIENYGLCSDEFNALILAWEEICLDTDFTIKTKQAGKLKVKDCEYFSFGAVENCWDSPNAQICLNLPDSINHGVNPNHITWTVTGPGSVDFESQKGMQGNQQQGGTCLRIISIPELEYYPRWYNIRINFTTNEGLMSINHRLWVYDCTGTKPDCETYHSQRLVDNNDEIEQDEQTDQSENIMERISTMEIYDLLGRMLYKGKVVQLSTIHLPQFQPLIVIYLDENGSVLKTNKTMKIR